MTEVLDTIVMTPLLFQGSLFICATATVVLFGLGIWNYYGEEMEKSAKE